MATGHGFFQGGVFEVCINFDDKNVSRRPYHRNCNCPLHELTCEYSSRTSHLTSVSYPVKLEGSLATTVSRYYTPPVATTGKRTKATSHERSDDFGDGQCP
ncbi:hypothetical protein Hanom_Chr12g01070141 [Helianthus anomalus]